MDNLLGWFFLFIIFLFTFAWTKKIPNSKNFLLVALILRCLCLLIDNYDIINVPDSGQDTKKFDIAAREFSNNYGYLVIFEFFKGDSLLISRIISIFYTTFNESQMMARSISVALGTASVYLVYHLSMLLWNEKAAKRAAWFTALFPTLILYSSLILKETYIVFFLLIGLIGIVKFMRYKTAGSLLQIITSFIILMFFHGPVVVGGLIFLLL